MESVVGFVVRLSPDCAPGHLFISPSYDTKLRHVTRDARSSLTLRGNDRRAVGPDYDSAIPVQCTCVLGLGKINRVTSHWGDAHTGQSSGSWTVAFPFFSGDTYIS